MKHLLIIAFFIMQSFAFGQTYCTFSTFSPSYWYIRNFSLNDINRSSGYTSTGYDNTNISGNLSAGFSYNLSISAASSISYLGDAYKAVNFNYRVYIDYNGNGSFADAGELLFSVDRSPTEGASGNVTIPSNYLGYKRLRVVMYGSPGSATNGCSSNLSYGEAEDYTVNIVSCPTPATPTITGNHQICSGGGNYSYGLIGTDLPYSSYTWTLTGQGTNPIATFYPANTYTQTGVYPAVVHTDASIRSGTFNIQVQGTNSCGAKGGIAYFGVEVDAAIPPTPVIQGPATAKPNTTSVYTLGAMTANVLYNITPASSYNSFFSNVYGQLTANWSSTFTGATISATVTNGCGTSNPGYKTVGLGARLGAIDESATADGWNVNIYPNPSDKQSTLVFNNAFETTASIEIYDTKGVLVYSNPNVSTLSEFSINENLSPGIYNVKVTCGGSQKAVRFVKSN